jgi:hypothetical protein
MKSDMYIKMVMLATVDPFFVQHQAASAYNKNNNNLTDIRSRTKDLLHI